VRHPPETTPGRRKSQENSSESWIGRHLDEVWSILVDVANATTDEDVRAAYARVDALRALPDAAGRTSRPSTC
jgi:hypothetical protein